LKISTVDKREVKRAVGAIQRNQPAPKVVDEPIKELAWKEELLGVLKLMRPDAFERLSQRVLRESGFTQVEVTGRSGDGGIDGRGVIRLGGVLSFHVIFQCKRYKGSLVPESFETYAAKWLGVQVKGSC